MVIEDLPITYEASWNEPTHPDLTVVLRLVEAGIGNCGFGCKIYADPLSHVRVLAHNAAYGCKR